MKSIVRVLWAVTFLSASALVHAQSAWSSQDYDLYPGDFNGDGLTDMLYVAKDPSRLNGIVLSDGSGLNTPLQTWDNAYLGLPWFGGLYNVVVADFNGDGMTDILLQRTGPGDHYLLLTEDAGVTSISQTIPNDAAGLTWSADQHQLVAGDFNGDGKVDLFLQPTDPKGLSAVVLADANGQFTSKVPDQSWNEGYEGFNWATTESAVYAGDFNGDGLTDLLVQAQPLWGTGPGTTTPAQFSPNTNGVALVQASKQIFALEGVQAWSQDGFAANWSPLSSSVLVGDFNTDGRSDVLLQGLSAKDSSYLLYGHAPGAIFTDASTISGDVMPAADAYMPLVGRFTSDKGSDLYFQSTTMDQTNFLASVAGSALSVKQADASLPVTTENSSDAVAQTPAAADSMAVSAPVGGGSTMAAMAVTMVGRTLGAFAVSQSGAATYTIPLWAPPGPRGIQPFLALTYNSQVGNGIVGVGWAVSGPMMSIERCPRTSAEDAAPSRAITLTAGDRFCLNGNRLRVSTGAYGAAGSTYQTEIADFSRVTAIGTAGTGPQSFKVESKDGLIYEYGNTTDSRVLVGTITSVLRWMLNKVSDRNGNNYTIFYNTATGFAVPNTISWTPVSAGSLNYQYTAVFGYSTNRADKDSSLGYVAGQSLANRNRLDTIKIQSTIESTTLTKRLYALTYTTGPTTSLSRLTQIQECAGDAGTNCISPTNVVYQDGQNGVNTTASTVSAPSLALMGKHDFNGDGQSDLVYVSGGTRVVVFATATGFSSPFNTGISSTATILAGHMTGMAGDGFLSAASGGIWSYTYWNGTAFTTSSTGISSAGVSLPTLEDINGDGFDDLITYDSTNAEVYTRLNNGGQATASFSTAVNAAFATGNDQANCGYPWLIKSTIVGGSGRVDFDGDGKGDLLLYYGTFVQHTGNCLYHYKQLISTGTIFTAGGVGFTPTTEFNSNAVAGRMNNDQCSDFVWAGTASVAGFVSFSTCDGATDAKVALPATSYSSLVFLMDWDGDGRSDLLINNGGTIGVYLMTSVGFSSLISTTIPYGSLFVFDKDGDGLDDLAVYSGSTISYYLHGALSATVINQLPDVMSSVADGYGVSATVSYASTGQSSNYVKGTATVAPLADDSQPRYVVGSAILSDGIGATYSRSYFYKGARSDTTRDLHVGFEQVTETDSRNGVISKTTYEQLYPRNGMVKQQDLLQSDSTVISSSVMANVSTTLVTTAFNQSYFPHISTVTTTTNEVGGAKNGLANTSTLTTYTYNATDVTYGNPTSVATSITNKDAGSLLFNASWGSTKSFLYSYASAATTNWCVGIPTQVSVAKSAPAQLSLSASNITRVVQHPVATIDYVNCRITQTIVAPLTSYQVTEDVVYDNSGGGIHFGNVTTDTITGANVPAGTTMAPRVMTITWATTGQFPVTIRDPVSMALASNQYRVVRDYDYSLGMQKSEVTQSLDGTVNNAPPTTWSPDAFGRIATVTRPDGTSIGFSYNDCSAAIVTGGCQNGDPAGGVTSVNKMVVIATQKDSTGATVRDDWTYLDQLDRTIVTKSKTLTGTYNRVGTQYDVFGNVSRRTEPCDAASCTPYWTVNHYDTLNRLKDQQRPNWTQAATVLYQGRTTVYTDPQSKTTTRVNTVVGQMAQSLDHNTYRQDFAFDAIGSLVKVVDNSSPVNTLFRASYAYGVGAYQTDAADMDLDVSIDPTQAGTHRHYTYDALGELLTTSDSRNSTVTFDPYDPLGRPTRRVEATSNGTDLTTLWTWGTSAASHNIGQLGSVSATGPQAYVESYGYNPQGRLNNRTIQGSAFDLTYNMQGTIDTLTYPVTTHSCRVKVQYGYQNGIQKTITDISNGTQCALTGTVYWTANNQNPRGEITQETLGNNVVTNRGFDGATGWLLTTQAGAGGGSVLQNLSYQYDQLGNVTLRRDLNGSPSPLSESICYDSVYRMDHTTATMACADPAKLQMSYNNMGNILSKTSTTDPNDNVGNYTYDMTHKHRVLAAGANYSYTYDNNGNAITRNGSSISWTSYDMPLTITSSAESSTWSYGQDHQKWYQQYTASGVTENTTYFAGLLEKVVKGTVTDWRHYIFAGNEQVVVYSRSIDSNGNALTNTVHYTLEDHQGSLSAILPGTANPTLPNVNESFEPYGTRREPTTWSGPPGGGDVTTINGITRQGYTGQTMLGGMNLIHMNGRVEDSVTGRFLSADPYITEPGNTQNFNRYSYVYNNPLSYVDPSGYATCYTQVWIPPVDIDVVDAVAQLRTSVHIPGRWEYHEVPCNGGSGGGAARNVGGGGASDPTTPAPPEDIPPCVEGPSTATGSATGEFYAGPGGGETVGVDNGHPFVTARAGFGVGGALKSNPKGGLPITPADPNASGTQRAVTIKGGVGYGISWPLPIAISITLDVGVAYDSNTGFEWVRNIEPHYGAEAEKGIDTDVSIGAEVSAYEASPTVYTGHTTCKAHF